MVTLKQNPELIPIVLIIVALIHFAILVWKTLFC